MDIWKAHHKHICLLGTHIHVQIKHIHSHTCNSLTYTFNTRFLLRSKILIFVWVYECVVLCLYTFMFAYLPYNTMRQIVIKHVSECIIYFPLLLSCGNASIRKQNKVIPSNPVKQVRGYFLVSGNSLNILLSVSREYLTNR